MNTGAKTNTQNTQNAQNTQEIQDIQKSERTYEEFFFAVKKCSRCALRSGCAQVVPGDGNPNADILFIGEGPGKREDELGTPFVGAAGKFLDTLLASINLDRKCVYIANVVKCRPPNNRDPLPEEISECAPWLDEQISIIDPKLIVTLGRYSLYTFLPDYKISEAHGRAFLTHNPRFGDRAVFAMYHPAAALYNGSMREVLLKDFQKIPHVLKKLTKVD